MTDLATWTDLQAAPFDPSAPLDADAFMMAGDGYREFVKTSQSLDLDDNAMLVLEEIARARQAGELLDVTAIDLGDKWGFRWTRHRR